MRKNLLSVMALTVLSFCALAETRTVSAGGDIQSAITAAEEGDEIVVAAGVYEISANLVIDKAVTLRGATGNPADVVITRAEDAQCRILKLTNGGTVEAMTLQNGVALADSEGDAANRSGSIVYMADGTVRNCVIEGGNAVSNAGTFNTTCHSVGVYMNGSEPEASRLVNCVVRNNQNWEGVEKECGGGVFVRTFGTIEGCMISNNVSRSHSGAVGSYDANAKAVIRRSVIYKNYAGYQYNDNHELVEGNIGGAGAGKYGVWKDCLIAENKACYLSQKSNNYSCRSAALSDAEIYSCTVVNNHMENEQYGGIAATVAYNSIILGNTASKVVEKDSNYATSNYRRKMTNCCSWPSTTSSDITSSSSNNIWINDAKLVTATIPGTSACAGFVYAFAPSQDPSAPSPVIDAGAETHLQTDQPFDIGEGARLVGSAPDMGCYETIPMSDDIITELSFTPSWQSVLYTVSIISRGNSHATSAQAFLVVSANEDLSNPIINQMVLEVEEDGLAVNEETAESLQPDTDYYMAVRTVNNLGTEEMTEPQPFRTVPETIAFTCSRNTKYLAPSVDAAFAHIGRNAERIVRVTARLWETETHAVDATPLMSISREVGDENWAKDGYGISLANPVTICGLTLAHGARLPANTKYWIDAVAENDLGETALSQNVVEFTTPKIGDNVWANTGTDLTSASSYVYDWVPGAGDTVYFETPAVVSPVVTTDLASPLLKFKPKGGRQSNINGGWNSYGYVVSGSGKLHFSQNTGNDHPAHVEMDSSGTNTITCAMVYEGGTGSEFCLKIPIGTGRLEVGDISSTESDVVLFAHIRGNPTSNAICFNGSTEGLDGKLVTYNNDQKHTIEIGHPKALVNMKEIELTGGNTLVFDNKSGKSLTFAASSLKAGNTSVLTSFLGSPVRFTKLLAGGVVETRTTVETANLELQPRNSNIAQICVQGVNSADGDHGILKVTGSTVTGSGATRNYVVLKYACFCPMTDAAWPESKQVVVDGAYSTLGLNCDYTPMIAGPNEKMFYSKGGYAFGFTAFGGNRTVCINNDETFELELKDASLKFTDNTTVSAFDTSKKLKDYNFFSPQPIFGSRLPEADGTILLKNPLKLMANITISVESFERVIAARLQGAIRGNYALSVGGNKVGGWLALDGDCSGLSNSLTVKDKANLLVNNTVGCAVSVSVGCALGGMGTINGNVTVAANGGILFGGERGKGGCLTLKGKLSTNGGNIFRVELPAAGAPVGYINLENTNNSWPSSTKITVTVDADKNAARRGEVKVLDWTNSTGTAPTLAKFTLDMTGLKEGELSIKETALYLRYKLETNAQPTVIFVR